MRDPIEQPETTQGRENVGDSWVGGHEIVKLKIQERGIFVFVFTFYGGRKNLPLERSVGNGNRKDR